MRRGACRICSADRGCGYGGGKFLSGGRQEGSLSLALGLWRGGGQSGAEDHGDRRNLSERRHFAENSFPAERANFHALIPGKGTTATAAGERSGAGRHQRQGWIAGSGPLRRLAIGERPKR